MKTLPRPFVRRFVAVLSAAVALASLATPRATFAQQYGGVYNALGVMVTKMHPGTPGVTITRVIPGSPGSRVYQAPGGGYYATLDRGDVVFSVNGDPTDSVRDFNDAINQIPPGGTVLIRGRGRNGVDFYWRGWIAPVGGPDDGGPVGSPDEPGA